jgi:hypothetical protein
LYFHLEDDYVPIYSGPGERGPGSNQFPPGFVYVSYIDRVDSGGVYYLLQNGAWIPGKGSRVGEISAFQGLGFHSTPRSSFGWPFEQIPVKVAPGYGSPETGIWLNPFSVVQIYDTQNVDNADWNMIGPNQWLEARKVAQVVVNTAPPAGVTANRWIEVNLAEQTLSVYDNRQLVFVSSPAAWNRSGEAGYSGSSEKETETMRNAGPADFITWTTSLDDMLRCRSRLHSATGGRWLPQSGCVNLRG